MNAVTQYAITAGMLSAMSQFPGMVTALYDRRWPTQNYDRQLAIALGGALGNLQGGGFKAVGVQARVFGRRPLSFFPPAGRVPFVTILENFKLHLQGLAHPPARTLDHRTPAFVVAPGYWGVCKVIPKQSDFTKAQAPEPGSHEEDPFTNYAAVFFKRPVEYQEQKMLDRWGTFCQECVAPMLFDVFRHRERRMMPFAPAISELYWKDEVAREKATKLKPPWHLSNVGDGIEAMHKTVTLSVDLRKSTYAMEQAVSDPEFGRWLGELVQVIIKVCHEHNGVFDKFTGDGGLMHFLVEECRAIDKQHAVAAAVKCANELRIEIRNMLPKLLANLRNDSDLLGAGISIAQGNAFWTVDHRDNPIAVGRGVVDACRICDKTPSGAIRMQNYAYRQLKDTDRKLAYPYKRVPAGNNKETSESMQVMVWEDAGTDGKADSGGGRIICPLGLRGE